MQNSATAGLEAGGVKRGKSSRTRVFRNLPARRIKVGELSSLIYCKQATVTRAESAPPRIAMCTRVKRAIYAETRSTPSWRSFLLPP